jgi:signal-transduction protein with cAMP-binding, CBS, and nucleotidyltransferase domain
MQKNNVGAIVVLQQGRPVGIVTDRDLALATCAHETSPQECVRNVMTCPVSTIRADEGIFSATQQMMEQAVRRLPVVDQNERLVGLVSLDDLILLLSREIQNIAEGVRAEISVG